MTIPTAATPPKKSKVGATFVKSQNGTRVSVARDNGENRAIPATRCSAKRAASNVRTTY